MQRRNFLKYLALLFSAFIYLPESVKSAVRQVFTKGTKNIRIYSKTEKIDTVVPFIRKWDHIFIPVEDFAQAMHYGLYTNEEKKKCVVYIARDRITFTANNTFIKVNDELVQVPMESIWENGEVWAPLTYFVPVMSKYSALFLQYDESGQKISVEPNDINISEVQISEKENGTLIRVSASTKFSEKDIVLDIRNNYFHIDVYGGKINPDRFATISGAGISCV